MSYQGQTTKTHSIGAITTNLQETPSIGVSCKLVVMAPIE
jgi:hypothetical protein